MRTTFLSIFVMAIALFGFVGCENPNAPIDEVNAVSTNLTSMAKADCVPQVETLTAGQHINIGNVTIWNDATTLYVQYNTTGDWYLGKTHVNVSSDAIIVDGTTKTPADGRPAPGKYTVQTTHSPYVTTYTYEFSLAQFTGEKIYILTHAEAHRVVNGVKVQGETAFGGSNPNTGSGWWFYSVFVPCVGGPEPTYSISGTAFQDFNENGLFDANEQVYAGVTITLSNGATAVTDANGNYSFTGLSAGSYTVIAGDMSNTIHVTPASVTTEITNSNVTVNFGYQPLFTISGYAYFDVNGNGTFDAGDVGLANVGMNLSGYSSGSTTTNASGYYEFTGLRGCGTGKDYTVTSSDVTGLIRTTSSSVAVTILNSNQTANFGYALDLNWIKNQTANGFTIGYWKNNLDKAIAGKTNGIQVSKATLLQYVSALSNFALFPLNVTTMQQASSILSATGSDPVLLLSKQLMGSEFNYQNGAYIGGNQLVTYLFTYYGEYVITNASQFTSAQILAAKNMYDGYNNSHGGLIVF